MAMDPAGAATILCYAGWVYVKFEGRRTRLGDSSRTELDSIRQGRGRADGHSFARKYARLVAELGELEAETPTLGPELPALGFAASASRRTPSPQKTKDRTPESPKLASCVAVRSAIRVYGSALERSRLGPCLASRGSGSHGAQLSSFPCDLRRLALVLHHRQAHHPGRASFPVPRYVDVFLYAVMLLLHIIADPKV